MSKVSYDALLNKIVLHDHDDMVANTFYLIDSNGHRWAITVNTSGALITTDTSVIQAGNPIGLLLALTYAG